MIGAQLWRQAISIKRSISVSYVYYVLLKAVSILLTLLVEYYILLPLRNEWRCKMFATIQRHKGTRLTLFYNYRLSTVRHAHFISNSLIYSHITSFNYKGKTYPTFQNLGASILSYNGVFILLTAFLRFCYIK